MEPTPRKSLKQIASLDVIWKGNFVFGVGLGYREVEFDAFRIPRAERVRRFEECLTLVKRLWTEDAVSFEEQLGAVAKLVKSLGGRVAGIGFLI